jgi:hypothetical protein
MDLYNTILGAVKEHLSKSVFPAAGQELLCSEVLECVAPEINECVIRIADVVEREVNQAKCRVEALPYRAQGSTFDLKKFYEDSGYYEHGLGKDEEAFEYQVWLVDPKTGERLDCGEYDSSKKGSSDHLSEASAEAILAEQILEINSGGNLKEWGLTVW